MSRRVSKHSTVEELLKKSGSSEKFEVNQGKKGITIKRNGKDINSKQKTELYLNEKELKAAGKEFLGTLSHCRVISTDNMPLLVGRGVRVKTREPGLADQHLCIRGLFVAVEGKMPGKTLDPDQIDYKRDIEAAMGIHIEYHSLFELETELLKHKLISRRLLN
ncbi:hypothetical protein KAR91_06680 [Candidatus Pacearchaeota archaeon]|nr:hypothetical protein [Candidatus Pacearchaeota archaeon]